MKRNWYFTLINIRNSLLNLRKFYERRLVGPKIFLLLMIVGIAFFAKIQKAGYADRVRNEVQSGFIALFSRIYLFCDTLINTAKYEKGNIKQLETSACLFCQREIEDLRQKNALLIAENQQARQLIKFFSSKKFDFITTRLLWQDINNFGHSYASEIGTQQGVSLGNVVLSDASLWGRVTGVTDKYSKITPLTDSNVKIPIYFIKSQQKAVMLGGCATKSPCLLRVKYLSEPAKVENGDWVVTSGELDTVPFGIPIGWASVLSKNENNDSYNLVLPSNNDDAFSETQTESVTGLDSAAITTSLVLVDDKVHADSKESEDSSVMILVQPRVDFAKVGLISIALSVNKNKE